MNPSVDQSIDEVITLMIQSPSKSLPFWNQAFRTWPFGRYFRFKCYSSYVFFFLDWEIGFMGNTLDYFKDGKSISNIYMFLSFWKFEPIVLRNWIWWFIGSTTWTWDRCLSSRHVASILMFWLISGFRRRIESLIGTVCSLRIGGTWWEMGRADGVW
jgi:hypothetical protein